MLLPSGLALARYFTRPVLFSFSNIVFDVLCSMFSITFRTVILKPGAFGLSASAEESG